MCVDHGASQAGRKLRDSLAERPPDQVGSWPGEATAEPAQPWGGLRPEPRDLHVQKPFCSF